MILRNILVVSIAVFVSSAVFYIYTAIHNGDIKLLVHQGHLETESTFDNSVFSLTTIYQHDSKSSKTPGRFQRLELDSLTQASHDNLQTSTMYKLKTVTKVVHRPKAEYKEQLYNVARANKLQRWNQFSIQGFPLEPTEYTLPDVKDRETVLALSEMSFNAYTELGKDGQWYDLGADWRINSTFGWDTDGLRGHVFGNMDKSILIISLKGTSGALFNGEPTGEKDKLNDNMLFSCCCGRVARGWTTVCDCYDDKSSYRCDQKCLEKSLLNTELYYDYASRMYVNLADEYPGSTIWLTGHSLGGAVASLVGQTYGAPAVSFESPGDRLASERLHLPRAPGEEDLPVWHFGHTADPIFIGVCTGPISGCYYAGFAMETRCHAGKSCVWDTVKDNGWRVNIATHRIGTVIESILKKPEQFSMPECKVQEKCDDCGLWTFFDSRDSKGLLSPIAARRKQHPVCT